MKQSDDRPARIELQDFDDLVQPAIYDCVMQPHAETGLEYASIDVFGTEEQSHDLYTHVGNILKFSHIIDVTERQPKQPSGLGIMRHCGWTHGSAIGTSKLQRIAYIEVLRYDTFVAFPYKAGERSQMSYVFNQVIPSWLGDGFFEFSYQGTIKKRHFTNSQANLFRTKLSRGKTSNHFFFRSSDGGVSRFGLPSLEFSWKAGAEFDQKRYYQSATMLLGFVHGVALTPITRSTYIEGNYIHTAWPGQINRDPVRHRRDGPIFVSYVADFLRDGIRTLVESTLNLEVVADAIERFIYATTKVSIERSFVSGCEAIEALFKLIAPERPALDDASNRLYALYKAISRREISSKGRRAELNGKVKNALMPGTWPRIYSLVLSARSALDPECQALIKRAKFHRYRSQFVHGAIAETDHEMFVQRDILEYVFVALLLHLLRDEKRRPPITDTLRYDLSGSGEPIRNHADL